MGTRDMVHIDTWVSSDTFKQTVKFLDEEAISLQQSGIVKNNRLGHHLAEFSKSIKIPGATALPDGHYLVSRDGSTILKHVYHHIYQLEYTWKYNHVYDRDHRVLHIISHHDDEKFCFKDNLYAKDEWWNNENRSTYTLLDLKGRNIDDLTPELALGDDNVYPPFIVLSVDDEFAVYMKLKGNVYFMRVQSFKGNTHKIEFNRDPKLSVIIHVKKVDNGYQVIPKTAGWDSSILSEISTKEDVKKYLSLLPKDEKALIKRNV